MAFVGTHEVKALIDELSEYTDNIYAVVADEYGNVPYPGGNITVISKHLDEDGILRWIEGSNIKTIIDGTAIYADEESKMICEVAKKAGVEYLNIVRHVEMSQRIHISRSEEDMLRHIEYTHGNVLVKSDKRILQKLTAWDKYKDKICPMVLPDDVVLKKLTDAGYSRENIICFGRRLSSDFLVALIREYDVTQFVMMGSDKVGMQERLQATEIAKIDVVIYGEIEREQGFSVEEVWNILADRYGL